MEQQEQRQEEHGVRRRWREVDPQATWPASRHGHSAVVWPNGPALCVYGGFGGDGLPLDDLFLFDLLKGEWREAVKKAKAKPAGRHSHTAVAWRDSMFVFGGATADPSGVPSGQLLEFNFRKAAWSEVKTKGQQPKPRWGHSAVLVTSPLHRQQGGGGGGRGNHDDVDGEATMWVFGGFTTTGVDNDLFCFHFRSKTWERVEIDPDSGVVPSARHLHSAVASADGQSMVVVGGFSGSGAVNMCDAFRFHFGKREWREVAVPAGFKGRRGHRAAAVMDGGGEVMVVHGGRDKAGPIDDLHQFRFDDESWSEVKAEALGEEAGEGSWPSARYFHSLTAWAGRLWMFGGLGVKNDGDGDTDNGQGANKKPRNLADLHQFCSLLDDNGDFVVEGNMDFYNDDGSHHTLDKSSIKGVLEGKHRRAIDFIQVLPSEISLHILSFLPSVEVGATLPLVSKKWQRFVEDDALWRDALHTLLHSLECTPVPRGSLNSGTKGRKREEKDDDVEQHASCKAQVKEVVENEPGMAVAGGPPEFLKMVILGQGGVGKSSLTIMFIQKHFVEEYDPTIEDSYRKQVRINGRVVLMDILDTAGPEEFSAMQDQWIRTGSVFLMVYSITNRSSFDEIAAHQWEAIMRVKGDLPFSAVLVGNKCDVDTHGDVMHWDGKPHGREVTFQEGAALARRMSKDAGCAVPFIETSAKYNVNVTSAFAGLALMEMRRLGLMDGTSSTRARAKQAKQPSKCVLS